MIRRQDHHHHHQQQQSRVFHELSSLILNILRSPPSPASINFSDHFPTPSTAISSSSSVRQITPAGFASLMLGISVALMLCGSVTFFIGFMLLPWVIGLVMFFYFVGLVSSLSVLGRMFLCYAISPSSSPPSPRKDIPAENAEKLTCSPIYLPKPLSPQNKGKGGEAYNNITSF